jgi:tetratricopeptide (TPR) repeat protein
MKEAEEMYLRVLKGYEEARGPKHKSTLNTVNNLGNLYTDQGKTKEARKMFARAAEGYAYVEGDHEAKMQFLQAQLCTLSTNESNLS